MKFTKNKRFIRFLLVILCLCFLIPFGSLILSRWKSPATTIPAETEISLESLLGPDYVRFVTDTITMQMENRMDKTPEIPYYPIVDGTPLSDYVTIGEETQFEIDEEGYLVILFPAGTVTDPIHGEQRFRIARITSDGEDTMEIYPEDDWKLLLVNPGNKLPDDFTVKLTQFGNGQAFDERAYTDLQTMLDDARAEGLCLEEFLELK